MPTLTLQVQRFTLVSSRPFDEVVGILTATMGRCDLNQFHRALATTTSVAELERIVHAAIGPSGLMEFIRFDVGEVLSKGNDSNGPRILRLVVGNPLIMKQMAETVPDAASYAPVTILVDERADGVHLSYDSMASLLAPYRNEKALAVARDLDANIKDLLRSAQDPAPAGSDYLNATPHSGT